MARHERLGAHDLTPSRAIIDIGSNTVRLVIYGGPPRAPTVLHNEKVTAKLGKGVAETGRLAEKAAKAALAALARYRQILNLKAVPRIDVVATAAVRDAADGADFLAQVAALGFEPRLLSGEEEAVTSATGVLGAFPGAKGVVADLGGGSLELVDIADERSEHGVSLPLGTLRLPALREKGDEAFNKRVSAMLAAHDWAAPHGATLYLVGGSFRSFARYALQDGTWPSDDPHGFQLNAQQAAELARRLARRKADDLPDVAGIASARLGALPDAAALLLALIRTLQPRELVFSSWGLREGLLYGSLDEGSRHQDPLLASVAAFIEHHGATAAAATMMAGWTAPAQTTTGSGSERLRLAATMLSLASANVEPNLRADLSVAWAMRKRWVGITNRERAMVGASLIANTGRLNLPDGWKSFAPAADLEQAQAWGLAVRLCRRFSGCSAQSLSASVLTLEDDLLTLAVQPPYDVLVNDAVEKDLKALGSLLGARTRCAVIDEVAAVR